ncbi:hypothetical protein ND747_24685 [Frankia sp. R82]|nr:hypothetical protein [Frankia sp. R82]
MRGPAGRAFRGPSGCASEPSLFMIEMPLSVVDALWSGCGHVTRAVDSRPPPGTRHPA